MSEQYSDDHDGSVDDGDSLGGGSLVDYEGGEGEDDNRTMEGFPPSSSRHNLNSNNSGYHRRRHLEELRMRVQAVRHMLLLYLPPTTSPVHLYDHNNQEAHYNETGVIGGSAPGSGQHHDKGFTAPTTMPSLSSSSLSHANPTANTSNSLLSTFAAMAGSWLGSHFTSNSAYHKQVCKLIPADVP